MGKRLPIFIILLNSFTCSSISICIFIPIIVLPAVAENSIIINPTGETLELYVTLRRQSRIIGSVLLRIDKDQAMSLDANGVIALLSGILNQQSIEKLQANKVNDRLTEQSFFQAGMPLLFDASNFELQLSTSVDDIEDSVISLKNTPQQRHLQQPANFSGYINLLAGAVDQVEINEEVDNDHSLQQNHELESALRGFDTVLEYSAHYDKPDASVDGDYYRKDTRLIYDHLTSANRIIIGDIFSQGRYFQDSVDLIGLGISRDFSLTGSRNTRQTIGRSFTLKQASDVDVFVSGNLVNHLTLEAGNYSLKDIPLTAGNNDVELVITNTAGNTERISFSVATGEQLLIEDTSEFSFALGSLAEIGMGNTEYDHDQFIFTSDYRYGISPGLTLGINSQAKNAQYQLAFESLFATSFGVIGLGHSSSQNNYLPPGYATAVSYDALFSNNQLSNRRLTLSTDIFSPYYMGINTDLSNQNSDTEIFNDNKIISNISYQQSLFSSLSTGIDFGYNSFHYSAEEQYSASFSVSDNLFQSRLQWSVRLSQQITAEDKNNTTALLSLSWKFDNGSRLSIDTNSATRLKYSVNKNSLRSGGASAYVQAESNENNKASLGGGIDYSANRFYTSFDHQSRMVDIEAEQRDHVTRARFNTGFAFAGNSFAFGRPINNSFAIINRHESLKDNKLHIDPREGSDLVVSDGWGNLLISDLGNYQSRIISYDVDDLAPGYDLGEGIFSISAPLSAGYNLQVGSDATITLIGSLFDGNNKEPISLISGQAILLSDSGFAPIDFFTNRKGRFAISGMKPGYYELKLATSPNRYYRFNISKDSKALVRIGKVFVP